MRNAILTLLLFGMLAAHANPAAFYEGLTMARLRGNAGVSVPWTPADLTGLALWLDASDASTLWADTNATTAATNNGLVARWDDKSGNANRIVRQSTVTNMPVRTTGGLVFDGQRHMSAPSSALLREATNALTLTVAKTQTTPSDLQTIMQINAATNARLVHGYRLNSGFGFTTIGRRLNTDLGSVHQVSTATTNMTINASEIYYSAATISIFQNGTQYITNAVFQTEGATANDNGQLFIGANASFTARITGTIAEIIQTENTASTSDRQKLEGYLAHKWGLAGNLPAGHPYKSAAPTK